MDQKFSMSVGKCSLVHKCCCYAERKDKIEDGNRFLIQKFQSQLTQQLELLHKTVASSVTQQEVQLKHMEEDMESFVSTKSEVRVNFFFFNHSGLFVFSDLYPGLILRFSCKGY